MAHEKSDTQEIIDRVAEGFAELGGFLESAPLFNQGKHKLRVQVAAEGIVPYETGYGNQDENMYMASTVKPNYLIAFIQAYFRDTLRIEDCLSAELPLDILAENIARNLISSNETKESPEPLTSFLLATQPDLAAFSHITVPTNANIETIVKVLKDKKLSMRDLIALTLGPSSNYTVALLRKFLQQELDAGRLPEFSGFTNAVDILEHYYNNLANGNGSAYLNGSTRSSTEQFANVAPFSQQSAMMRSLFDNIASGNAEGMGLSQEELNTFLIALQQVPANKGQNSGQEFEIKSRIGDMPAGTTVLEKSGYDPEVTINMTNPEHWQRGFSQSLNWEESMYGADTVQLCDFAQIRLPNGTIINFDYSLAVPYRNNNGKDLPVEGYPSQPDYVRLAFAKELEKLLQRITA